MTHLNTEHGRLESYRVLATCRVVQRGINNPGTSAESFLTSRRRSRRGVVAGRRREACKRRHRKTMGESTCVSWRRLKGDDLPAVLHHPVQPRSFSFLLPPPPFHHHDSFLSLPPSLPFSLLSSPRRIGLSDPRIHVSTRERSKRNGRCNGNGCEIAGKGNEDTR